MTPTALAANLAPPLAPAEVDRLADEIADVASHIDAAEHRLLTLIRRFDEGSGWATHGALSCAHWLNWRIGLDLGAARERVRVARALGALPLVDDALRRGAISYSKVRALTRVASAATEATLLDMATRATASQLERICRGYRRVLDDAAAAGPESLADEELRRFVRVRDTDDGMVRIEAHLRPDEAALVVHALDVARRRAWRSRAATGAESSCAGRTDEHGSGVSAETSDTNCPAARARDAHNLSAHTGSAHAHERQPHEPPPALSRADALVAVAEAWLATTADTASHHASAGPPIELVVHVDDDAATATLADGTPISLATARRLACDATVVLATNDPHAPATSKRTRRISQPLRRALRLRDDGCRFPGCTNRLADAHHVVHWTDGGPTTLANLCSLCRRHHRLVHEHGYRIVAVAGGAWRFFRGDGSVVPLADAELRASSRRVVHDDGDDDACSLGAGDGDAVRDEERDPAPDGAAALRAAHARQGLDIDATTAAPRWDGERVDYGLAVQALLATSSAHAGPA